MLGAVGPSRSSARKVPRWVGVVMMAGPLCGCRGCAGGSDDVSLTLDAGPGGLSARQAEQVLARVGDRAIRLADYAAAMERMDELERLRYQTKDRRRALLDEMIDVELLAREAERRGLHEKPETQALIRQFQRDAVLRRLRRSLPGVDSFAPSRVAEYYRTHPDEFQQPEMRRAASIDLPDEKTAREVLGRARGADAAEWKRLVDEYAPASGDDVAKASPEGDARGEEDHVPGDLGTWAERTSGGEGSVDPVLREALFGLEHVGDVHAEVLRVDGRYHVLRLVQRVAARRRTLAEVDAAIRVRLLEELQKSAELELVSKLRSRIEVVVDDDALSRLPAPEPEAQP